MSLEELLQAPTLPANVPHFELIEGCVRARARDRGDRGSSSASEDEPGALSSRSGSSLGDEAEATETESEEEEVFPCDCRYDAGQASSMEGQACGAGSGCINRTLFIECNAEDCGAGAACQNQRFQQRRYARVKVVETPGKGFGLFTCEDLRA